MRASCTSCPALPPMPPLFGALSLSPPSAVTRDPPPPRALNTQLLAKDGRSLSCRAWASSTACSSSLHAAVISAAVPTRVEHAGGGGLTPGAPVVLAANDSKRARVHVRMVPCNRCVCWSWNQVATWLQIAPSPRCWYLCPKQWSGRARTEISFTHPLRYSDFYWPHSAGNASTPNNIKTRDLGRQSRCTCTVGYPSTGGQ